MSVHNLECAGADDARQCDCSAGQAVVRAAAPDMLEALRLALNDLDEFSRSRPAVVAAIAKAEGRIL